ncbi:MAG: trypsin-like peptidase domain-containing protein [Streptococcaceae bacterium]|jgi:serine protease Do|nr:trypsin-like peptidase domain-containing protein [Streptococcaceae bacterium]
MAKGTVVKTLLAGIAGGAIALSGGAIYEATQGNNTANTSTTTTSSSTDSKIKTVNVKVSSDTTKAISTIKDAVVSVLNYQGSTDVNNLSDAQSASEGSGVIYKKENGKAYIVTNNHVIEGNSALEVLLSNGKKTTATVVGSDVYSDLAVLTIDDKDVTTTATFADSSKLSVGEPAIAVGSPLGSEYANTATEGILSSLSRTVSMQNDAGDAISTANALQTDAAINPGNSGGALVNINGQVIGITSSKISATGSSRQNVSVEGMGFAIPSNDVVNIVSKLEKDGKIVRPALGIEMRNLSSLPQQFISDLKLPKTVTEGAFIVKVTDGMPASNAGLKVSDVVTKIDDTPITTGTDLQTALYKYNVGDTIKLTVYRGSEEKTISVKLDKTTSDLSSNNSSNSDSGNNN